LQFAPHALHFILVSHTCTFTIDPTEQGLEGPKEQAKSLSFMFEALFIILFDCALSLQGLYGTVVALGFSFSNILVYPCYNSLLSTGAWLKHTVSMAVLGVKLRWVPWTTQPD
jgi:hypothetical protein